MGPGSVTGLDQQQCGAALQQVRRQYCSLALSIAIGVGALLIFSGHRDLGKGLLLGSVFSIVNFMMMAAFLPLLVGQTRRKASFISLSSILVRMALLAVPLAWSLHSDQFAVSTTAAGLFMVQVAIVADHVWRRLRNQGEVRY
jgi:branched-subunit amino acid transport protein AzlD